MALAAAQDAIQDAGLSAGDIDEIIVATDTPEVYAPDTASFVQHRLGAREVPSYDLGGSGCAGYLQALDVARSRVNDDTRHVLMIGVEVLSRLVNWRDRNTCVLFGDAAGAAIVGQGGRARIVAAKAGTDGSRVEILWLECGGTRLPFSEALAKRGAHQNLIMKGQEVFREAVKRMTEVSQQVLDLPEEKLFTNVQELGNTGSASVAVGLWQAYGEGRIHSGDLVLLTSFGAGLHWASVLLQF